MRWTQRGAVHCRSRRCFRWIVGGTWISAVGQWILIPAAILGLLTTVELGGSIQILAATLGRLRTRTRSTVFPMRLFQTSPMLTFDWCNLSTLRKATVGLTQEILASRSIRSRRKPSHNLIGSRVAIPGTSIV